MAEPIRLASSNAEQEQRLPRNIEAEAALLGALLVDNRIAADVQMRLKPHHFFEPLHARIYEQVIKLIDRDMTVTPVTLKPFFEHDEALKDVGGVGYLARLTESSIGVIGASNFAGQIYDLALLRELVSVGRQLVENALDTSESVDPKGQIEAAESALYTVSEGEEQDGRETSFLEASKEAIRLAEKALQTGGGLSGITTGLDSINRKIGGLHASDLTILAGRPGMGKTSLATNIAFNTARRWMRDEADGIDPMQSVGAKVGFFSLEMSADQLATRILAEQSGISSEALRMGKISREDFRELARASREIENLPLYIDDTPGLSIAALRGRARRLKRRRGVGLIVIDYLQLLQGSARTNDGRVNEISEISRGLKTLAKELGVPVLALSQLSRAVESREDKRPQLSDLRESGSIEQDADIVMFIYRAEYYHDAIQPDRPDDDSSPDEVEKYRSWHERHMQLVNKATLMVAKQRHGSTGNIPLHFQSEITKFSDLADDDRYSPDDWE